MQTSPAAANRSRARSAMQSARVWNKKAADCKENVRGGVSIAAMSVYDRYVNPKTFTLFAPKPTIRTVYSRWMRYRVPLEVG